MDPIDEIDGKKKRRTMLENMQRSSSMFQSRVVKGKEDKAAEKAKEETQQAGDYTTDFSSEFTNQDANLNSEGKNSVISNWEDILEDDDWLTEEDEDESEEESSGREYEGDFEEDDELESGSSEAPPPEWKPPVKAGGFFKSSFAGQAPPTPPQPAPASDSPKAEAKVEEKLGFAWGPPAQRKPEGSSAKPLPPVSSAGEDVPTAPVPLGATRRTAALPSIPKRERPPGIVLPVQGRLEGLEEAVVRAARLLIVTPESEPGYEECIRLLSRFGLGAIRLCTKAKVKVHILDEGGIASFGALSEMGLETEELPVDGAYLIESKTCLIDRRCLLHKPRHFHPALYYFAHALDHAQGGEEFSSRKAAAVLACFDASVSGFNGADFVDELAAADPVRYFARSVAIYLGRDDCEEPLWTHQDLKEFDRSMHDYLEYLFARLS